MTDSTVETPLCECGCGEQVTPGLVFGKPRRYIRGHGPQAKAKASQPARNAIDAPPVSFGESPSLNDLKAAAADRPEDRAPGKVKGKRGKTRTTKDEPENIPPFRAGPIAAGMNKLYLRTGKLVRVMDHDIGTAIIGTTKKESDDDVTVGEAWEELAKTNPRIRAFLLKMIAGGAYTQLIMAHAPIFLAIIMKDGIKKHIPFMRLIEAVLVDRDEATGDEQPTDIAAMLGGLSPQDAQQMAAMAQGMMAQMGFSMDGRNTQATPRTPEVGDEAA